MLSVTAIDKDLQTLRPPRFSHVLEDCVSESPIGLKLKPNLPIDTIASYPLINLSHGVVISCNGISVQSKDDFMRALQFSDARSILLTIINFDQDPSFPLPSDWAITKTQGGRVQYVNTVNRQVSWLHPHLQLKPASPFLMTLSSYLSGQIPATIILLRFKMFLILCNTR
jgi:hypothetical protein